MEAWILTGGGSRGAYQAGLLAGLQQAGRRPDLLIGTSIGAAHACAWSSGMDMEDLGRLWARLRTRDLLRLKPGIRPRAMWMAAMQDWFGDLLDWDALPGGTPVRVTALDLAARRPVIWHNHELTPRHLLASMALVPFLPPVTIAGRKYVDGGLWDNPPLCAIREPIDHLVVLCHEPMASHAEEVPRGWRQTALALADITWHARVPKALEGLQACSRLPKDHPLHAPIGKISVLAPSMSMVPDLMRFNPETSQKAWKAGCHDADRWTHATR